jgi:hypothetical protein
MRGENWRLRANITKKNSTQPQGLQFSRGESGFFRFEITHAKTNISPA